VVRRWLQGLFAAAGCDVYNGMRNHSNFTVVPVPDPGFLLVPVSVPVPAQRSKRKLIQLADATNRDFYCVFLTMQLNERGYKIRSRY